jgi:hypothetical protein
MIDDNYEPKLILTPEQYDSYLLMLHRDLAIMADNLDPPNPFRGMVDESEGLAIRINDTNDLPYAIQYMENKIEDKEFDKIILADPRPIGYKYELLEKFAETTRFPCQWFKTNDWIIFILNTKDDYKLVIQDNKFFIQEQE